MDSPIILVFGFTLAVFLHQLALNGFFLPVEDSGRFFIIFPLFIFPNDTFFFNHPLKSFDCLFKYLVVVYNNMGHCISPPFRRPVSVLIYRSR